jgi:hypothetical protein
MPADGSFRTVQALSDLRHFAGPATAQTSDSATCAFRQSGLSFADPASHPLLWASFERVVSGGEGFASAACLWLIATLEDSAVLTGTEGLWEDRILSHDRWQLGQGAAAVQALWRLQDTGVLPAAKGRDASVGLTRKGETIAPALLVIARRLADAEDMISQVSRADYGQDSAKHLAALRRVLARESGQFGQDESWYPSEVVELVAHVPGNPGFVECSALLLLNALAAHDLHGHFDSRWERMGAAYIDLPEPDRLPILRGIRYLYEADQNFLATAGTTTFQPGKRRSILPVPVIPVL